MRKQPVATLCERAMLCPPKVAAVVRQTHRAFGGLLCASKSDEVVQYALTRSLSPALIAQHQTQLPDKKLLQAKLHELMARGVGEDEDEDEGA